MYFVMGKLKWNFVFYVMAVILLWLCEIVVG